MRLQIAMLYVKELPRMAEFYEAVFGAPPIAETRTKNWAEFQAGAVRFGLHAIPAEIGAEIEIASPPEVREDTPQKLLFAVTDVDAEAARLEALGAVVFRRPWGSCDAVDPEGNVFGIYGEIATGE